MGLRYRSTDLRFALATRALQARVQLPQPLKTKKGHLAATLFYFWWGRREFESSLRSTDLRFASATRALQAQVQLSRRTNKKTTRSVAFLFVGGGGGSLTGLPSHCFNWSYRVHFWRYAPNYAPSASLIGDSGAGCAKGDAQPVNAGPL